VPQYTRYTVTKTRPQARLWLRIVRWVVIVIVIGVAATAGMIFGYAQHSVAQLSKNDPVMISQVRQQLAPELPGQAMNILVLGGDKRIGIGGDPGRSDTMLLMRLDPKTKSISMMSIPRDLRVNIPGHGVDRINTAYSLGGAKLAVQTFADVTGIKPNHFIYVDFLGFVHIVDALGGVYVDVDRDYYNPPNTGYAAIDVKAGYQKLDGKNALGFVRFRHDATGDWGRMVRQQMFLRELKRQAVRWNNWRKIPKLVDIFTHAASSDMDSLRQWLSLARLAMDVNTSSVYNVHLTGQPVMIGGASELEATPAEIHAVVEQFLHPDKPPITPAVGKKQPKSSFTVYVSNAGAPAGTAASVVDQLKAQGYQAVVSGDLAPAMSYTGTRVFASRSFSANAAAIAGLMQPAEVVDLARTPGMEGGVSVVVGPSFTGQLKAPASPSGTAPAQTVQQNVRYDAASWQQLAQHTPIRLQMPTAWSPGLGYDWSMSRSYTIPTGKGNAAADAIVGTTPLGKYWHIQVMRWTTPPAVASPDETRTIGGVQYSLFYNGPLLHMVSWRVGGALYWIANSLDNEALSKETMMALATSFKPVK